MATPIDIPFSRIMMPSQANDWTKGLYPTAVQFLRSSAEEIAILVDNPDNMARFRSRLTEFADEWKKYRIAEQARQEDNWQPAMGRPENPLGMIWPSFYEKQSSGPGIHATVYFHVRPVLGSYALLQALHDHVLPKCTRIDNGCVPQELSEKIWQRVVTYAEGEPGSKGHVNIGLINRAMREVAADLHDGAGKQKVTQGETVAGNESPRQAQDTDTHDSQGLAPEKIQPATIYEEIQIEIDRLLGDKDYSWLWEEFARHAKHFKACFEAWKSFQDGRREVWDSAAKRSPFGERVRLRDKTEGPPCPSTWEIKDKTCCHYVTVGIIRDELAGDGTDKPLVRHILSDPDPAKDAYAFTLYLMGGEQFRESLPYCEYYDPDTKRGKLKCVLLWVEQDIAKIAPQRVADKREMTQSETGETAPPAVTPDGFRTNGPPAEITEAQTESVTLNGFMENYCQGNLSKSLLASRKNSLLAAARQERLTLPSVVGDWHEGKPKYFAAQDLIAQWSTYKDALPNLPSLKSEHTPKSA
jgi:hypothetical protein